MHVKLEVETQPLGHLWIEIKRRLKIATVFSAVIFVNILVGVAAFSYLPDLALRKRHDSAQGVILAWAITISITLLLWINVIQGFMEGRAEARRRFTESV